MSTSEVVNRYADWINSEIAIYETYHSHKENMVWVVTALYIMEGSFEPSVMGFVDVVMIKMEKATMLIADMRWFGELMDMPLTILSN